MICRLIAAGVLAMLATVSLAGPPEVALVGGTLIDVDNFGETTADLVDSTVLIRGEVIVAVGRRSQVAIPPGARIVDVHGEYIIPGLIDGFAAQRSQGQANAHLAMGITTIIGMSDDRRGLLLDEDPQPHIKRLEDVTGYDLSGLDPAPESIGEIRARGRRLGPTELAAYVDTKAWDGDTVLWLGYSLDLEQLRAVVAAARRHKLATIGELGHASYVEAAEAGVQAFVHMERFMTEVAPPALRHALADDPFPARPSALGSQFETFLGSLSPSAPEVRQYAARLAHTHAALVPTTTLYVSGTEVDRHNPWASEIGPLVDPHDVHAPLDPATGTQPRSRLRPREARDRELKETEALMRVQSAFIAKRVAFLAASGTTAFGVLPGDGLHWEMHLLTRLGLSPRQALAAATGNYARVFGWTDRGRIAPGCLADIVVLAKSPVESIDNSRAITRIYLAGRELDRPQLLTPPR
ncbi:MAG TPA: amidohydrolase family protein [Steroidobacteraceae bacterium]|nr:amidohydrolase family protein [Steroidobacteraceae bacterium]